jgi:hypothetical protein
MPHRVVETGVILRAESVGTSDGHPLEVSAEIWIDIDHEGETLRFGGQTAFGDLPLGEDPTKPLIDLALSQRDMNLGSALGDARIGGFDITRFECYAAPFRIELDDQLRSVLSGTWDERDPRV